jgi:hypothetical protein
LTKLGISYNNIRAEGGKVLAEAIRGNQVITELNIANNNLGMDADSNVEMSGVASLAAVIPGMGSMTALNLAGNQIGGYDSSNGFIATEGMASLCCKCHTSLFSSLLLSGPAAIADAIRNMGALTSLNLSSNKLKAEGAEIVAGAIKVTNCLCDCDHFGPLLCPSDYWLNCCCSLLSTIHRI